MTASLDNAGGRYRDEYLTVADGLQLHYRDFPSDNGRLPLLCLPGLTRNARDFADLAERYSPRFRVLALEFRGRGDSDYDPQPMRYNPLVYAADVLQLLDRLDIPEAIFVGTSLGGLVTMTVASMAPQRIAATILNDIGPDLTSDGLDRIRSYVGKDVRFASWDEAGALLARNNNHVPSHYSDADWVKMARRGCREEDGEVRFDYDMAIGVPFEAAPTPKVDLWPLFAAVAQKPLLVVRGEISDLLSVESFENMRQAAPHAKFVEVHGVGHAPDLNEPEAVEAIDAFLNSLPA